MEPMKIMNQEEVQKFLLSRGGNKTQGFDNWEGFTDFTDNKIPNPTKDNNLNPTKDNNIIKKDTPKYEPEPKFYNGDQILKGDYFKGWNDSYFFQSSVFRENNNFWVNPFK